MSNCPLQSTCSKWASFCADGRAFSARAFVHILLPFRSLLVYVKASDRVGISSRTHSAIVPGHMVVAAASEQLPVICWIHLLGSTLEEPRPLHMSARRLFGICARFTPFAMCTFVHMAHGLPFSTSASCTPLLTRSAAEHVYDTPLASWSLVCASAGSGRRKRHACVHLFRIAAATQANQAMRGPASAWRPETPAAQQQRGAPTRQRLQTADLTSMNSPEGQPAGMDRERSNSPQGCSARWPPLEC